MKNIYTTTALILNCTNVLACTTCNKNLQSEIFNSSVYYNLLAMLSAFIVLAAVVITLTILSGKKHTQLMKESHALTLLNPVPLTTASMILGIGLGGFFDGIVLHQILQWHEMLSNKISTDTLMGKNINMFWDGVFHFFCLAVTITGVLMLWKLLYSNDINRSGNLLSGGLLFGWALFNIIEGIINHHILKLHYVRQASGNPTPSNLVFLAISGVMLMIGVMLLYKRKHYKPV